MLIVKMMRMLQMNKDVVREKYCCRRTRPETIGQCGNKSRAANGFSSPTSAIGLWVVLFDCEFSIGLRFFYWIVSCFIGLWVVLLDCKFSIGLWVFIGLWVLLDCEFFNGLWVFQWIMRFLMDCEFQYWQLFALSLLLDLRSLFRWEVTLLAILEALGLRSKVFISCQHKWGLRWFVWRFFLEQMMMHWILRAQCDQGTAQGWKFFTKAKQWINDPATSVTGEFSKELEWSGQGLIYSPFPVVVVVEVTMII